ncbi:MAG: hypothetical protein LBC71_01305 [Oscillospiraceae bacterium]|jgi:hypothetical protein|nr:hypothetical protein [Oscillospiraceae bacterium]
MKILKIFILLLLIIILTTGCVSHKFAYEYDDLRHNLIAAELVYLENELMVFHIHWIVDIEDFEHTLIGTFAEEDFSRLIRSITKLPFRYLGIYLPVSVSQIMEIEGYVIALYYADGSRILIAQNAEHRQNTQYVYGQFRTARKVSDEVWNDYINQMLP